MCNPHTHAYPVVRPCVCMRTGQFVHSRAPTHTCARSQTRARTDPVPVEVVSTVRVAIGSVWLQHPRLHEVLPLVQVIPPPHASHYHGYKPPRTGSVDAGAHDVARFEGKEWHHFQIHLIDPSWITCLFENGKLVGGVNRSVEAYCIQHVI